MSGKGIQLLRNVLAGCDLPSEEEAFPLVQKLVKIILGEQRWSDRACSQQLAVCVWSVLADAARENWTVEQLEEKMDSDHPLCRAISETYKTSGKMLRCELETVGWDYPELVDVEWSVRNIAQTELLNRVSEPVVSLKLHAIPTNETHSETIEIHCDANQFQDLHAKVKEAINVSEQLKKM